MYSIFSGMTNTLDPGKGRSVKIWPGAHQDGILGFKPHQTRLVDLGCVNSQKPEIRN